MATLTTHMNQYLHGRRTRGEISASTAADYRWTLHGLVESFGDRPLHMFGPAAIDRWLETIGHHSDATRREYLSRARQFCGWLTATGRIRNDPTGHVPRIRQATHVPRTLTATQIAQLLRVLPDNRARAIVWLMVGCGCRCVEVARLRVEDYDPDGRTILLTGKAGNERIIPTPTTVAQALDAYLDDAGIRSGPLIRSKLRPSHGLSPKTLSGYLRCWLRQAAVKTRPHDGRSAHALRRTCASDVIDAGYDVRIAQHILGHARLETTVRHYVRPVTIRAMREAMEARAPVIA